MTKVEKTWEVMAEYCGQKEGRYIQTCESRNKIEGEVLRERRRKNDRGRRLKKEVDKKIGRGRLWGEGEKNDARIGSKTKKKKQEVAKK